jgi:hypothetical protein
MLFIGWGAQKSGTSIMSDNAPPPPDDEYTRQSFGMRRMSGLQLRVITLVVAAIAVVGIGYVLIE